MQKKRIALYPGTFDPVTFGHIDIMRRALKLFDQVIVAVALNPNKSPLFSLEDRVHFIKDATKNLTSLKIIPFDNLLINLAHSKKASVVIKGLRAISDFEFELQMGLMNRTLDEEIETLFMIPSQEFSFLSSNLVKETARHGGDVSKLVPKIVFKELKEKFK
jgi:pantetheine-phosphate adenylyltransferase